MQSRVHKFFLTHINEKLLRCLLIINEILLQLFKSLIILLHVKISVDCNIHLLHKYVRMHVGINNSAEEM